jgi:hypothetical protein
MPDFVKALTSKAGRRTGNRFRRRCRLLPAALIFLCLPMMIWGRTARAADKLPHITVNCDVHKGACTQEIGGVEATLDISPKPVKAMTDLRFRLMLSGKPPAAEPYIDLGMPGMKMGPNKVRLEKVGEGVYEGTGIIVRCTSGKRTWKAAVTVPGRGTVEFIFDVVY